MVAKGTDVTRLRKLLARVNAWMGTPAVLSLILGFAIGCVLNAAYTATTRSNERAAWILLTVGACASVVWLIGQLPDNSGDA